MRREWDDCQGDEEGDDARKPRSTEVYVAPLSGSGGSREAALLGSDRANWGARTATEVRHGPPGVPECCDETAGMLPSLACACHHPYGPADGVRRLSLRAEADP